MLTLLGAGQGQNNSFDADYQAVLNRAILLGYALPSAPQQIKQNNLVLALKAAGIWNKLDVLYIFANDAGSNFATLNWKNPNNYQVTLVNTPIFTANQGFKGNGTSSFIDTNFNASINGFNYKLNDASRYIYLHLADGTSCLDGLMSGNGNRMITSLTSSQRINTSLNINFPEIEFTVFQGMKSIHRTSSTNIVAFNNSSSISATQNSDANLINQQQTILRAGSFYGAHRISMYALGSNLVLENTNFVNAFNTYINSL